MLLGSSLFAAQVNSTTSSASVSPIGNAGFQNSVQNSSIGRNSNSPSNLQGMEVGGDDIVIPNAPIITPSSIIEISAIGMGVAPESTVSPAQALALAKRAAIVDAYRQIGEKMYGIRVNAQDTVRDMMLKNSTVKTKVLAVIRNAEIIETVYKDGLCQVSMELKLDGKRWYRVLTGEQF
ncbi:LPP20 family lipoprotein [Helicobacter sp. MIT 11-5569]|uniref:LPP20 family lipoprotein n=1 Tax=Helicobacter sp. MIT 11-5569 TaxID=1548151 RepID=UPI003FA5F5E9